MLTITILSFVALVLLGMPIVFALGLSATAGLAWDGLMPLTVVPHRMFAQVDSFALLAVPFFVLAGEVMERGGISTRLVALVAACIGHLRGGLAMVCVVSSFIFAGLTGSSAAEAAALGSILIPAMIRQGYPAPFAASLQASAATMGPIVPPSTLAIIYASITGVSVGALFAAGIVPGLLMGGSLLVLSRFYALRMDLGGQRRASWAERRSALRGAVWALVVPVIILGGILSGAFTATESGAVAAVYAIAIGLFVHRELRIADFPAIFARCTLVTGMVMIVLATAGVFSWILVTQDFPRLVADSLLRITREPALIMLLIMAFLLFIGAVMEIVAAGVIMIPVLTPIAAAVGFHPVHFAMVVIITMALGAVTPPVGVTLYLTMGIARVTMSETNRFIWPMVGALCFALLVTAFVPEVSLFIPRLVFGP